MNNESDKFDDLLDIPIGRWWEMVYVGSVPTPEDNYE